MTTFHAKSYAEWVQTGGKGFVDPALQALHLTIRSWYGMWNELQFRERKTIEEARRITWAEWRRVPNLGAKSVREIMAALGSSVSLTPQPVCPWCGKPQHAGMCPEVKAIEYYPDGKVQRVEFKTAADYPRLADFTFGGPVTAVVD